MAAAVAVVQLLLQELPLEAELGNARGDDGRAGQAVVGQVHALCEHAAQHYEGHQASLWGGLEALDEFQPRLLPHPRFLADDCVIGPEHAVPPEGLGHVGIGGKAGQVIPRLRLRHRVDHLADGAQRALTILHAHGHGHAGHVQVFRRKRRIQPQGLVRLAVRAQHRGIVFHRREGGREQRAAPDPGEGPAQVFRRVEAPQPHRQVRLPRQDQRFIGVRVELLRHPNEPVHVIDEIHQLRLHRLQLHGDPGEALRRLDDGLRQLGAVLLLRLRVLQRRQQLAQQPRHRAVRPFKFHHQVTNRRSFRAGQLRGQHVPGAVRQVVGLVHQQPDLRLAVEVALQPHLRVEDVVVVADDHVGGLRDVQGQLEGAQPVGVGQVGYGLGVQPLQGQRLLQGVPTPVVVARGQLAAHAVRLLHRTDLLLGGDGHAAQGQAPGAHELQGVLGSPAPSGAGSEIEYRRHIAPAQSLQRAEQRGRRLADAGGGLDQGVGMAAHGGIHRRGHVPLALPVGVEGKGQCVQRGTGSVPPVVHRGDPAQVGHGVGHQPLLQLPGVVILAVFPLPAVHAGVGQVDLRLPHPRVQAKQRRVDLPLGPMGGVIVFQYG